MGSTTTPTYQVDTLQPGHCVVGPALLIDKISTIVVEAECTAAITSDRNILISVKSENSQRDIGTDVEPIQLAIFMHRRAPTSDPKSSHILCRFGALWMIYPSEGMWRTDFPLVA